MVSDNMEYISHPLQQSQVLNTQGDALRHGGSSTGGCLFIQHGEEAGC